MSIIKREGTAIEQLRSAIQRAERRGDSSLRESLVILLDASGSMDDPIDSFFEGYGRGEKKIVSAIKATKALIGDCQFGLTQVAIVSFNREIRVLCQMTKNLTVAAKSVERIMAGYETFLGMGLFKAIDLVGPLPTDIRRIVLMSDGIDDPSRAGQTDQAIIFCVQRKIIVDTVAFGLEADRGYLQDIARRTGGVFKEAGNAKELVTVFKSLEAGVRGLLPKGGDK